ncbi:MAG TPA: DUF502 domain-containing protein, partial [Polyangiaceae bacterium]|nr:DUF502 domain-containing protein [Polyangiaceae bacterium]
MGARLIRYFVRGCLVSVPLVITAWLIFVTFRFIDDLLHIGIPGVGFVLTISLVTLIGLFTSNVVGKRVFQIVDRFLSDMPLVKLLYTSIK